MPYIIRFTDPHGAVSYYPEGFGFTAHAHAETLEGAARFKDSATASRSLNGYINPPAFWNSERAHAEKMRNEFRNWKCEVVKTNTEGS